MKYTELRGKILAAFEDTVYPGDGQLISGGRRNLESESRSHEEDFALALQGKDWAEVYDIITSVGFASDLYSLTPLSFQFYLPAYLLASLNDSQDDEFVYYLATCLTSADFEKAHEFVSVLTSLQIDCVCEVFSYLQVKKAPQDPLLGRYLTEVLKQSWVPAGFRT